MKGKGLPRAGKCLALLMRVSSLPHPSPDQSCPLGPGSSATTDQSLVTLPATRSICVYINLLSSGRSLSLTCGSQIVCGTSIYHPPYAANSSDVNVLGPSCPGEHYPLGVCRHLPERKRSLSFCSPAQEVRSILGITLEVKQQETRAGNQNSKKP